MFEITIIETMPDNSQIMSHWPVDDEIVDDFVRDMVINETRCVLGGVLISYTMLSSYEQFNTAATYASPGVLTNDK